MGGSSFNEVTDAVAQERAYQDSTHGTDPHELGVWLLLIQAELDEAKHALLKGGVGRNSVRHELIQVAALCFAALEQYGTNSTKTGREI